MVRVHGAKGVGDYVKRERCGEMGIDGDKDSQCPDFGPSAEVLDGGGVEENELQGGHCHAHREESEEASAGRIISWDCKPRRSLTYKASVAIQWTFS